LPGKEEMSFGGFGGSACRVYESFAGFGGGLPKYTYIDPPPSLYGKEEGGENEFLNTADKTPKTGETESEDNDQNLSDPAWALLEVVALAHRTVAARDVTRNPPPSRLLTLIESGKTDLDVRDLDEALFLFAVNKVREASSRELPRLWLKYGKYWRERLSEEAFGMVERIYQDSTSTEKGTEEKFQQMRMNNVCSPQNTKAHAGRPSETARSRGG
jgi:hypothetical protein